MSDTNNVPLIYPQLSKVMADIGAVGKNKKAAPQSGGYAFRGIDDVMQALQPALVKHGVMVLPEVLSCERTEFKTSKGATMQHTLVTVRYTFWATDGSSVSCVVTGEGADTGDKSANKALAGAMKYAITQSLCIPTEEAKDSEHDHVDLEGGRSGGSTRTEPKQPPKRSPRVLKLLERAAKCSTMAELLALGKEVAATDLSEGEKKALRDSWGPIARKLEMTPMEDADVPY